MSTKAELFRYLQERAGWKRRPAPKGRSTEPAPGPGERRPSAHAGRKAGYALESGEGRPSRRSTRRSANRQKNDGQFRAKRRLSEARPEDRPMPRR